LSDSGFQGSDRQGASGGPIPSRPSSKLRRCDAPLQIVPAHVDPAARHARSAPAGRCATTFRTPEAAGISIPARHISCKLLRKTRRAHVALSAAKECIMKDQQLHELLFQAIETEQGGIQIYRTAIECAINDDLKEEWEEYLEQTENHVTVLENALTELELDPETETPGRLVVRHIGESLVKAMEMARESDSPDVAPLLQTGERRDRLLALDHLGVRGLPRRIGLDLVLDVRLRVAGQRAVEIVRQRDDDLVVDLVQCAHRSLPIDMPLHLLA
jgi:hypothetical protein